MATLSDISKITGVSISTISRVLNEQPGLSIPDHVKSLIFQTAEELNYRMKAGKRSAGKNKMKRIVVIGYFNQSYDINVPYYSLIRQGVEKECRTRGLDGAALHFEWSDSIRTYSPFLDYDGVIVIGPNYDAAEFFHDTSTRVVFLDCSPNPHRYDSVVADFADGTKQALAHLLKIGYSSIGYLGGDNEPNEHYPRYTTYKSILEKNGMFDRELVHLEGDWSAKTGYSMAQACIKSGALARAYFIGNDAMAVGAMRAFLEAGLRVPQDIAIVGFDDIIELSAYLRPTLTSVRVHPETLGKIGVNLLLDGFGEDSLPISVMLPTQLMVRESCGGEMEN